MLSTKLHDMLHQMLHTVHRGYLYTSNIESHFEIPVSMRFRGLICVIFITSEVGIPDGYSFGTRASKSSKFRIDLCFINNI